MPTSPRPLRKLGFLTIGLFDEADPRRGHESTLDLITLGEQLGFDSAWLRHRHLQYGISSPVAVLAAATQRTRRIQLGTAVTPLGWENPLRLAEDLATVDVLSGGRLNPGFSVGPPIHYEHVRGALYPDTGAQEDFSPARAERFLALVRGEDASDFAGTEGIEVYSRRVQPHSPGLADRLWYGAASLRSACWAGEQGLNLLTSNVAKPEPSGPEPSGRGPSGREPDDAEAHFADIQAGQIRAFRAHHPDGEHARVSQGLVVIPTDSATPEQRAKYRAYALARTPRTLAPQGPARLLFAPDLVGDSEELAERLHAHAGYREVDEVAFALPFTFGHEDYVQILTDLATRLGPALGWSPSTPPAPPAPPAPGQG
ncbi:LLM class flavin-dependent oxidoreductase [Streptomyces sp. CBMA123]|uniref:LLM class flavin-dependent oxidoreductase n=1 Tax=Streptomyces sp. CBMA123 TaxID=1896313 RepID=UPI001661A657|nr:LLM class flavin-dependent oxidoreductase [Streptomyces sp. CBMA123]MBD0695461.1 luciferase [Streptomyces sp. CBMA123]